MQLLKSVLLTSFLIGFIFSCSEPKKEKITIATAANMQFAMKAITEDFSQKNNIDCDLVISSSGKLTAQIIEGAPYDIFVAANIKYPQAVYNAGLSEILPKVYAEGKLVLWTMRENTTPSLEKLSAEKLKHVALANPKTAPYGIAAMQVLEHFSLDQSIKDKLVFGESIAQTNQFITSKSAELGFTALSVVLSPQMKGKGKWIDIDSKLHSPIQQGVIIIKNQNLKNSQQFYNYLFSADAKKILQDYGYSVND